MNKVLSNAVLENICNLLGDTNDGLTGTQIHDFLTQSNIEEVDCKGMMISKRKKLLMSFQEFQRTKQCSNNILVFIQNVMSPARFVNDTERFELWRAEINKQLAFEGLELGEDGKYKGIEKASTIADVQIKVKNLKQSLELRNTHREIFKYCKEELLQNNYFHAVFEANKGLFERIRELSGLTTDGNKLIEEVFSTNPILIINNYQSDSEKNEHTGFCNLLKGLCAMFRNPTAHEAKIYWPIEEQDAIEILGIISYCHRRLDKAQKIRMAETKGEK